MELAIKLWEDSFVFLSAVLRDIGAVIGWRVGGGWGGAAHPVAILHPTPARLFLLPVMKKEAG